jgi:hypothetical protein
LPLRRQFLAVADAARARSQRLRMLRVHTAMNCNLRLFGWTFDLCQVVFGRYRIRQWAAMADELPPNAVGSLCGIQFRVRMACPWVTSRRYGRTNFVVLPRGPDRAVPADAGSLAA